MKCRNCGHNNPTGSRYCETCGKKLITKGSKKRIGQSISDVVYVPNKKSSVWNKILLVLFIVFVITIGLYALGASEESSINPSVSNLANTTDKFVSAEHGFKIGFPAYPSTERIPTDTTSEITYSGTQYVYSTPDEGNIYLVQSWDYDISPSNFDNKTGLEGAVNGLVGASGYQINDSIFKSFKGYDAIEFNGTFEKNHYVKGLGFVRDDLSKIKFYLIMIVSNEYNSFERYYDNFISSFELTR